MTGLSLALLEVAALAAGEMVVEVAALAAAELVRESTRLRTAASLFFLEVVVVVVMCGGLYLLGLLPWKLLTLVAVAVVCGGVYLLGSLARHGILSSAVLALQQRGRVNLLLKNL